MKKGNAIEGFISGIYKMGMVVVVEGGSKVNYGKALTKAKVVYMAA